MRRGRLLDEAGRIRPAVLVWLLLFGLVGFLAVLYFLPPTGDEVGSGWKSGFWKYREYRKRKAELETAMEREKERNLRMRKEIDALRNDPVYQEKVARDTFGLAHPDEIIYRIEDKRNHPPRKLSE